MYNNIFQVSTEPFTRERQATADDVLAFSGIPMTAYGPQKIIPTRCRTSRNG